MPRGYPDYGVFKAKTVTAALDDMAELAVRLGSIVTYDRRGEVVDSDNFEGPVERWGSSVGSINDWAILDNTTCKAGSLAMLLHSANGAIEYVDIHKSLNVFVSKRIGLEISFGKPHTNANFILCLIYYDGAQSHMAYVWVDINAQEIHLTDGVAGDVVVANTGLFLDQTWLFYTIKVVVDFGTDKYVRLLFANKEYDISNRLLTIAGSVTAPTLWVMMRNDNRLALGSDLYLDNYILTQDEP